MATKSITPETGYSRAQIILHWTIAALVLVQLILNDAMRAAFGASLSSGSASDPLATGAIVHIAVGLLVLVLTLIRLAIRLSLGPPEPVAELPPVLRLTSELTHLALYVLLLAMPLTGAAAWFWGSEWAALAHEAGRFALVAIICLHALGALFEHYVMGNATLGRMLRTPPRSKSG
jgi:cytochrome b561